jgi:TetR/AcrR family transcriptional regulator, regulator of cefoperazone and chloramphenicol sensitivity
MAENETDGTRDRILEAAGQLFAERGFESTTVRDICQAAGANVAAVNYYFGDKERLYVEAVVRAHKWRLDQATLPDWDEHTTARKKLADFIETFFRRVLGGPDDTWRTKIVMREIMNPTAACAEIANSNIRPQFEILQSILRQLLPASTTDEELHLTAFSIVGQCLFYHVAGPVIRNLVEESEYATYDVEKLAAHVTKVTLAALDARVGKNSSVRTEGATR